MHPSGHIVLASTLAVAAVAATTMARNPIIGRRLRVTLVLLAALIGLHVAILRVPAVAGYQQSEAIEKLLLALAVINTTIALLFNRWFASDVPDRTPAIVQDAMVVTFSGIAAAFVFGDKILAASISTGLAIGLGLQEQLSNAFAGLAIQIEKPFRVGHWISVAGHEGKVVEVTWRATKLKTKNGNLVVLPNSTIAKESIENFSAPKLPTRMIIDIGVSYFHPPNEVIEAISAALHRTPGILADPPTKVTLSDFAGSAIVYRARLWIADYEQDSTTRSKARIAIYYEFMRRNIEIPFPIQVEYQRSEPVRDSAEIREDFARVIAAIPVLAPLAAEAHQALAKAAQEKLYADGEVIVREGEPGQSMFVVRRGRVAITIGPDRHEVAVTEAGGYFGEMSLLTGDPRTATVVARGDVTVLEISAQVFGVYVRSRPEVIDQLAAAAVERRRVLDESRAHVSTAPAIEPISLAQRMRQFFGLT
jgi:small-conductance mechanosensitive channel/CRP-like cAMP-binding protein